MTTSDGREGPGTDPWSIVRRVVGVLLVTASLGVSLLGIGAVVVVGAVTSGFAVAVFGEDETPSLVDPAEGGADGDAPGDDGVEGDDAEGEGAEGESEEG